VNALCEYLYVEAIHEGCEFRKKFVRGSSWGRLSTKESQKSDFFSITLLPDDEIFHHQDQEGNAKPVELSQKAFSSLLRQTAYLNRRRKFSLKDYRPMADIESEVFQFNDGIAQYALYLNEDRRILHEQPIYFATTVDQVFIECALQWTDLYSKSVYSFVNGVSTLEGGTHVSGFSSGTRRTLIEYGRELNLIDENEMMLYFDDFAEGLTAIINVRMEGAELTGKTLEYLSNSKVQEIAQTLVSDGLWDWLKENPEAAELIVRKGLHTADYNRKHGR
jgi:DNA gyrase subunit B